MVKRAVILGGGPCGLALADELSAGGVQVVLIEADRDLGGLAKTISWGRSKTDLGPHKLFSLNSQLTRKVRSLLPESEWLTHPKHAQVFLNAVFMNYPPSFLDLLRAVGPRSCGRCVVGFLKAQFASPPLRRSGETFEEHARRRMGKALYDMLFRPLALKIWGEPATLHKRLSESRLHVPSLKEAVCAVVGRTTRSTWESKTYFYPRGGLSRLWETMAHRIGQRGGHIILGDPVTSVISHGARVVRMVTTSSGSAWTLDPEEDVLLSTLPLSRLVKFIHAPASIEHAAASLRLNELILVLFKLTEDVLGNNSWIFVPDPTLLFHRLSGQHKFDPSVVEPDTHLLCCEVMNYANKPHVPSTDELLVETCLQHLFRMGLVKGQAAVKEARVIRLPSSYPVLTYDYEESLRQVLEYVDGFVNLRTVGRQGSFSYIGTLDAMDIGYGLASLYVQGNTDQAVWQRERERTGFYPILD